MGSDGAQIFYPDEYNGAWCACPDPIDFRAYTVVDIYKDTNAYWREGPFLRVPRPGKRDYLGHVSVTIEQINRLEQVLGDRSRSGQQWDIWEAVYSPVGADGYPQRIWDKRTGVIDPQVAAYWRRTTTSATSCAATGTRGWARSSKASCPSTSATWTTTT
jgi:hypothetical protein